MDVLQPEQHDLTILLPGELWYPNLLDDEFLGLVQLFHIEVLDVSLKHVLELCVKGFEGF